MRIDAGPGELAELSISAEDRAGLFAGIVGFLSSKGLNIVNGRIFTGGNGVVIDKISISNWKEVWWEGIELDLGKGLREVIVGGKPVATGGRCVKTESPFDIFIELDNEAFEEFTLIEIFSPDRLGLLYDIANVLHALGIDIISARINTESGLAQDIFYVQQDKAKIDYRKAREILSELWTTLKGTA
jgi:[protein-PII] uridylyltransferase